MKTTPLETRWQHLMSLCESERRFRADGTHPRLLKLLEAEIAELAAGMGFSDRSIATREFRAERENGRIVRILADG
jgi:AraC-like DNA-binding protein